LADGKNGRDDNNRDDRQKDSEKDGNHARHFATARRPAQ
jgi:hypothetical protein